MKIFIMKINHQGSFLEVLLLPLSLDATQDLEKDFREDEVGKVNTKLGHEKAPGQMASI